MEYVVTNIPGDNGIVTDQDYSVSKLGSFTHGQKKALPLTCPAV